MSMDVFYSRKSSNMFQSGWTLSSALWNEKLYYEKTSRLQYKYYFFSFVPQGIRQWNIKREKCSDIDDDGTEWIWMKYFVNIC